MKHCPCISACASRGNDNPPFGCACQLLQNVSSQACLKSLSPPPTPPPGVSTQQLHFNRAAASVILDVLTPQRCSSYSSSTMRRLQSGVGGDNDNGDQFWHDFAPKRCSCTSPVAGLTRPSISHKKTLFSFSTLTAPTVIPRFRRVCSPHPIKTPVWISDLLPIIQHSLASNALEVVKTYGVSMRDGRGVDLK